MQIGQLLILKKYIRILNRRKFKVQIIYENVKQAQHNQLFIISWKVKNYKFVEVWASLLLTLKNWIGFNYLGAWKWVSSDGGLRCVVIASPKLWFELLSSMIIAPPAVEVVMMSGVVLFSLLGSKEIIKNRFIYSNSFSANLTENKEGGFC